MAQPDAAPGRCRNAPAIRAPRGPEKSALHGTTGAPLRMLLNNRDGAVAEKPGALVVHGGIGRAARDWASNERILGTLRRLREDQTLPVQSGKPAGVFETHADAPRVLIANSNLVPRRASREHSSGLDRKGLLMYGQRMAGNWICIGSQGMGTYETFAEAGYETAIDCARDHGPDLPMPGA